VTDEIVIEDAEEVEEVLPAVAVHDSPAHPANLFGAATPAQVLEQATAQAKVLKDVIVQQGLSSNIQGREHVNVEGWTTLGSMLGVFPVVEWTKPLPGGNGWEARVTAQTLAGQVVGAAEAMCSREERTWAKRDDYAIRSMAQTRATSKAMRLPLGFVMQLAGYSPTPVEEMDFAKDGTSTSKPTRRVESQPQPETIVTDFPVLMAGVKRNQDGSWPRICPACGGAVEQKSGTNKNGNPYTMWKCRNRDCQGGDVNPRGGRWSWGSFHDDPWKSGGEIDDLIDGGTVTRTDGKFDPKKAMHAALSGLWRWDDDMKKLQVVDVMTDLGFEVPLSQEQVLEVAAIVADRYYTDHEDERPFG